MECEKNESGINFWDGEKLGQSQWEGSSRISQTWQKEQNNCLQPLECIPLLILEKKAQIPMVMTDAWLDYYNL